MITNAILKFSFRQNHQTFTKLQQVRFAKKTFRFRNAYGVNPLHTSDDYEESRASNKLEDLSYQEIRFPRLWETNSPFFDATRDKYLRHMMHDGRRGLMDILLHKTFYEIKKIQIKKLRKQQERVAKNTDTEEISQNVSDNYEMEEEIITDPLVLFKKAIENCKPKVITKKIRRGGAVYQVPYPISEIASEWLAMRWMNTVVKERPKPREKHYYEVLAKEVIDAAAGRGKVVKIKDDLHKLAQANKAYAHYRWG